MFQQKVRQNYRITSLVLLIIMVSVSACQASQPTPTAILDERATTDLPATDPVSIEATKTPAQAVPEIPTATLTVPASPTPEPSQTPIVFEWPTPAPGQPLSRQGQPIPSPTAVLTANNTLAIQPLTRWGKGRILRAGFSPDGAYLGLETNLGKYLFDLEDGSELPPIESILQTIFPVPSPLYTTEDVPREGDAPSLDFYLLRDGEQVAKLAGASPRVFSPDQSLVAADGYEEGQRVFLIYNTQDGSLKTKLPYDEDTNGQPVTCGDLEGIHDLVFSPAQDALAVGCANNPHTYLFLLDGSPPTLYKDPEINPDDAVKNIVFSPDGKLLAVGYWDGQGRVWDLSTGVILENAIQSDEPFEPLAFSPYGSRLAGAGEGNVLLRSVTSGETLPIKTYTDQIETFAMSPKGDQVAYESVSGVVIANLLDGVEQTRLDTAGDYISSMTWSPDGRYLAIQNNTSNVEIWRMPEGEKIANLEGTNPIIGEGVAFLGDGRLAVLDGKLIQLYTPGDWSKDQAIESKDVLWNFAFSPDGELVALASRDGLEILRTKTGKPGPSLKINGSTRFIQAAFSPDGRLLILDGPDGLSIYDLEAKEVRFTIGDDDTFAFSPDGTLLASAGKGRGKIRLWRISDGAEIGALIGHTETIVQLAFSPDGKYLLSNGWDNVLFFWGVQ